MRQPGEKYRPSNGTEGEGFIDCYCRDCIHGKYEHTGDVNDKPCDILSRSLAYNLEDKGYPEEWVYGEDGHPTCTAWKKWDWGRDDDGNLIDPPPAPVDDPNQLVMPFIFDELEIKKPEKALSEIEYGPAGSNSVPCRKNRLNQYISNDTPRQDTIRSNVLLSG